MGKESKRRAGIVCSLLLYFTYVILLMIRTKGLIAGYGSEVNAVFQASNQIFVYLTLFESGIGAAYQFKMYGPVTSKDARKIAGLFKGLQKSMKRIALKMIGALLVISITYPFIMDRVLISPTKSGLMLFLLGIRFVIPYFVSIACKTLLNVYDYKYVTDNIDGLGYIIITTAEIVAVFWLHWPIYGILLIGCIGNIIIGFTYIFLIKKMGNGAQDKDVFPDFEPEGMTKDILLHQITGLFNSNIDTIILSVVNIMLVTPYQAYYSIMNYFPQVINKVSENYRTKVGMKIKQHDKNLYDFFQLMMAFHMIAAIIAVSIFALNINSFIYLWIGKEYILSDGCVILLSLYLMLKMTINNVFLVRDGAGLYKESKWFSFWEGIINLILSITLVHFWGIEGILFATVFATYAILVPGNSRLVYKKVMGRKNTLWVDYLIIIITSMVLILCLRGSISAMECITWKGFLIGLFEQGLVCIVVDVLIVIAVKWKYISQFILKRSLEE